jgi:DNA polymerase III subunit delta
MVTSGTSVFLFIGSERYLKESALEKLKASLRSAPSEEIDHKVFYGSDSTASQIFGHAQAFPLFSSKKLIVIKDFNKLPKDDRSRLAEYIRNPAKSTYLVIDIDGDTAPKELSGESKHFKTVVFNSPPSGELSSWITKYLASRGKKIEVGAIDMLKELQGSSLEALSRELDKLVSFVGERGSVTGEDVEKLVGKSAVESAFELGWAIGDRDLEKAMKVVLQLMLEGKRPHETIGLITWHLNRMLKAKALSAKGESAYSVSSILRIARRHQDAFFRQARSFTFDEIKKKMDILLEADLDIKRTRFDPLLVLELAIVKLCLG